MSQQMSGWNFDSRSKEVTSHPAARKARPIEAVPLNNSNTLGIAFPKELCYNPRQRNAKSSLYVRAQLA